MSERTGTTKWTAPGSGEFLGAFSHGVLDSSQATEGQGATVVARDAFSGAVRWRFTSTPDMGLVVYDVAGGGASPGCPDSD